MARRTRIPFTVVLLATACAAGERDAARDPVFRDSAGIRIIENAGATWSAEDAWRVSERPLTSIGRADGEPAHQLWGVSGAWRLGDGRIVIANGGTRELRFYDAQGAFLVAVGREGEGPGEFGAVSRLDVMRGDTLVVFDGTMRRMTVFDAQGAFVRTFTFPAIDERVFPRPRGGLFADGSVLAYTERGVEGATATGAVIREPGLFFRLDPRTGIPDVIGELPIRGFFFHPRVGNVLIPFEPHPWPVAAGDVFYHGGATAPEIGVYSQEGDLERLIRWTQEPVPVRASDIDRFLASQLGRIENEEARTALERALRETYAAMPMHTAWPAYTELKVDAAGNLWVGLYEPPGRALQNWIVFDPDGRWLGSVRTPDGLTVYQLGDDFLLGRSVDDLGVERVVLFQLIR